VPGTLALRAMLDVVDVVLLVSDAALRRQVVEMLEAPGALAEGAAAAGFAALAAWPERWRGRTVAVVLTGSNIDRDELRGFLAG
jgi:threonine dehydratase